MTSETLLLLSLLFYLAGVVLMPFLPGKAGLWLFGVLGIAGSLALFLAGSISLFLAAPFQANLWPVPGVGMITLAVDPLSAFFLITTALVAIPATLFAAGNLQASPQPRKGLASLFFALLIAIVLVATAADAYFFLLAWEAMSILIYLLIAGEKGERPGFWMLAIGEAGTLAVLAAFLLMAGQHGLCFESIRSAAMNLSVGRRWTVFLLAFFGFGAKAGLIPLNFWMPRAYAAAPAAVIPLIAGATLNLGLYGLIRVGADFLPITGPGPGILLLLVGAAGALIGILYAAIEDNLKALLAHSSIENAGLVTAALGAGMIFLANGRTGSAAIAFIAGFYHLLNHSVFKTLLFMGTGAMETASGTSSLDRLGGLLKRMPWTGFFVLIGALAISAMPPFNGFVSEWLILESLLRSVELSSLGVKITFVAAGAGIALTAGLAVTCFVRMFAMSFLGMPRTAVKTVREVNRSALSAMCLAAFLCLALGVLPTAVIPALDRVVTPLVGVGGTAELIPPFFFKPNHQQELPAATRKEFTELGARLGRHIVPLRGLAVIHLGGKQNPVVFAMSTPYLFLTLLVLLGLTAVLVRFITRGRVTKGPVWAGGVRRFLPEMTYTATGFAQPVRVIFDMFFRPKIITRSETVIDHFRLAIQREQEEVHLLDRLVLRPVSTGALRLARFFARMHHGRINAYAAYALIALLFVLVLAFYG